MQKYELTVVLDSLQKSEDMEKIITKTESFIKNNGGEVHHVDEWGKKRLAYEINRKQYGHYYQIFFEAPGSVPGLLERELRLDESVLRFLSLKSDYTQEDFTEKKADSGDEKAPIASKESSSDSGEESKSEDKQATAVASDKESSSPDDADESKKED